MTDELAHYTYIWTRERHDWVLLADEESQRKKDFIPYNIKTWRMIDLDDRALHKALVERMIAEGLPQVTDEQVFGK